MFVPCLLLLILMDHILSLSFCVSDAAVYNLGCGPFSSWCDFNLLPPRFWYGGVQRNMLPRKRTQHFAIDFGFDLVESNKKLKLYASCYSAQHASGSNLSVPWVEVSRPPL